MNLTESVRPALDHGYDPLDHHNGSPYMHSNPHQQQQPIHHSLRHDNPTSNSVAALQRLSNTLEPSGETNGSELGSAGYHHQRSSPQSLTGCRKLTPHSREEDEAASESDNDSKLTQPLEEEVGRAQYLTANCVLFTYFRGDISQVVDDHFARALSQSSEKSKDTVPLSQRNLPPSFWISNYQYPISAGSSSSFFAHDLYHAHAHHAAAAAAAVDPYSANSILSTADVDPWQNYMAAAAGTAYSAHHRAAHDMYHSSRLNPQYSSFLLQSSAAMRQAHGRAAAALGKAPHDSWAASGQGLDSYSGTTHHYSAMTGLEGTMQNPSKDLYWF